MSDAMPVLVFGGAFDPIHKGHLGIADKIQKDWNYEEVWFVPCQSSRYGKDMADFLVRCAMCESAIEEFGNPTFRVKDVEARAQAEGRMYVMAKYLQATYPNAEMDFLIGSDSVQHFKSWYRWEDLRKEFILLVAQRGGSKERLEGALYYPDGLDYDMSSTTVREQIALQGFSPLLTRGVQEMIRRRGLYV
jgi:nicotinate (nicotinamide) nucleotide adenylyltransferase